MSMLNSFHLIKDSLTESNQHLHGSMGKGLNRITEPAALG